MISVVIPSRTDEYAGSLLDSMEQRESGSTKSVVVVDSGLSSEFKARWPQVIFVPAALPFVFAQAINAGVERIRKENDILVLNDDTLIASPNWHTFSSYIVQKAYEQKFGIVSAQIDGGVGNQEQKFQGLGPEDIVETSNIVCFVAALIPRQVWNEIGGLDTRYIGYGYDDNDYCARVSLAGYKMGVTGALTVKHGKGDMPHSSTFAKVFGPVEWQRRYDLNKRIFEAKWKKNMATMRRCLNIGCGDRPRKSEGPDVWVNLDVQALPGVDIVRDLRRGIPVSDATFDHVLADNILEHFDSEDVIFIINEIDRVLKVGGTAEIIVPHGQTQGAMQDPTHKSLFVPRSCLYWNQVQSKYGGKFVGITANLVLQSQPDIYGDPKSELFIRFMLTKEPIKNG